MRAEWGHRRHSTALLTISLKMPGRLYHGYSEYEVLAARVERRSFILRLSFTAELIRCQIEHEPYSWLTVPDLSAPRCNFSLYVLSYSIYVVHLTRQILAMCSRTIY